MMEHFLPYDDSFKASGDWQKLWDLHFPPEAKSFFWHVGRNVMPNTNNLGLKGVDVP
ncbi:hypothetical protein PTKIN_Ptkin11bG0105300 [Pterospermum kingtungense]